MTSAGRRSSFTRMRRPPHDDALLAAGLLVASLVQVLWLLPIGSPLLGVLIAVLSTAPIAWRRLHPVAATVVGSIPFFIPADGFLVFGYVAVFFLYYSLTAHARDRAAVGAVVAFGCAGTVAGGLEQGVGAGEWAGGFLAVLAPAGVGLLVRAQRARAERLEELAVHLESERERRERAAVSDERARIARELHDIVSHAVSVIAVQSDAAQAALEHDPSRAAAARAALGPAPPRAGAPPGPIRASAREALPDRRRLPGVLREQNGAAELEPLPSLAQIEVLVARFPTAWLHVDGSFGDLPPSLDLGAYRIVQEALTNTAKHAPGATVDVRLRRTADALEIEVSDDGPGPRGEPSPDAHGLVGMRERARLHGGSFAAGAGATRGFSVQATLPLVRP